MDELTMDSILTGDEIDNLFLDEISQGTPPEKKDDDTPEKDEKDTTTEVNPDELFGEPESVGSGDNNEGHEDTDPTKDGTSPKFFSSIAKAFAEEGIFPDLDDDAIEKVNSPEDFRELIEQRIKSELDERQKRVDEALNYGVEPSIIKQYENTLAYLDSIDARKISDEGEQGETIRRNLIMQDLMNRGYSKERAAKAAEKSFRNGDDIEDAKEALAGNREYFKGQYDKLVKDAKQEQDAQARAQKEQAEQLKNSILTDKKFFGELEVDNATRKKIFENIAKPTYKDEETGTYLTPIQKYELEHKTEFMKYLGLIFTLTDGFKNLDTLVKGKVRKEVKKGFRELENTLNNTTRNSDGSLRFVSGVDPESFIGKGWNLDI